MECIQHKHVVKGFSELNRLLYIVYIVYIVLERLTECRIEDPRGERGQWSWYYYTGITFELLKPPLRA